MLVSVKKQRSTFAVLPIFIHDIQRRHEIACRTSVFSKVSTNIWINHSTYIVQYYLLPPTSYRHLFHAAATARGPSSSFFTLRHIRVLKETPHRVDQLWRRGEEAFIFLKVVSTDFLSQGQKGGFFVRKKRSDFRHARRGRQEIYYRSESKNQFWCFHFSDGGRRSYFVHTPVTYPSPVRH